MNGTPSVEQGIVSPDTLGHIPLDQEPTLSSLVLGSTQKRILSWIPLTHSLVDKDWIMSHTIKQLCLL